MPPRVLYRYNDARTRPATRANPLMTPHGLARTGHASDTVVWDSVEVEGSVERGARSLTYKVVAYGTYRNKHGFQEEVRSVRSFGIRDVDTAREKAAALRREMRIRDWTEDEDEDLRENPRRRVRPATRRNPEPRYTLLGVDDEVVVCEKCGKSDLKCTVVLGVLDADGNIDHEVRFGRDCAAKALRKPRTVTAAKMEKIARGAEFKRVLDMTVGAPSRVKIEGNRWTNYYFSYRLTDGRTLIVQESDPSFRPPAGSWTRLREGAWVGHPALSNPRRRTAR